MKKLVIMMVLTGAISAQAESLLCDFDRVNVVYPADAKIRHSYTINGGGQVFCHNLKNMRVQIGDEKLYERFSKEMEGSGRNNIPSIETGTLKFEIKRHPAGLIEGVSYIWVKANGGTKDIPKSAVKVAGKDDAICKYAPESRFCKKK